MRTFKRKPWNGKGYDINRNIVYNLLAGKGLVKKYYYTDLKFKGQYLNGEKSGKWKEYYYDDKVKFEGEYLKGKKCGKGRMKIIKSHMN